MADTETYTVTKRAGPRVAGRPAKAGDELQLTELQARSEVLAGALVKGGKGDGDPKVKGKDAVDPFETSDELRHIQARARGLAEAPDLPSDKPAADAKSGAGKASGDPSSKGPAAPPAGGTGAGDAGAGAGGGA